MRKKPDIMKRSLIAIIGILFLASFKINAQETTDKTLSPYFFVKSESSNTEQMPLESTTADVNIAGVIADVTVTQVYKNEGNSVIEAEYVFPASTRAAVYAMEMKIGSRTITAKVKEKEQARREYETAKSEGKRASLLEQDRPNVFRMNVANIMPGDKIEVILKYTEMLVPTEGEYQFVYPTVVGPRYASAKPEGGSKHTNTPYQKQGENHSYHFDLNLRLNAGMPINDISSFSHEIDVDFPKMSIAEIKLPQAESKGGNRDFILNYSLSGGQISSGLMLYEGEDENFFTLTVQPPKSIPAGMIPPREYIFVVDVSGSMNGFPIETSKKLLRNLIANLKRTDKFNVLLFAGASSFLADESLHATPENVEDAMRVIDMQAGGGGTELLPALGKALALPRCENNLSRSVVVVTDGYINVERETFDLIKRNLNQSNVFAFGIGSGVNRHLIEGMAHVGKGEPFIIDKPGIAKEQAERFRKYIQTPVLSQVKYSFEGFDAYDVEPFALPDVMAERPILIYGKYRGQAKGTIKVNGYTGEAPYQAVFKVSETKPDPKNKALKYLWARERIKELDDYTLVGNGTDIEAEVTRLGLKYNLLTAYTSFVAIDHDEIASNGNPDKVKQPVPLPQGVNNYAVGFDFGISGSSAPAGFKLPTVRVTNVTSSLTASQEAYAKRVIYNALINNLCKVNFTSLDIKVTLDENGKIIKVEFPNNALSITDKICMQNSLLQLDVSHQPIKNETGFSFTIQIK